ncbi:hypothetical protein C8Q74DRAFT_1435057 [Fomes fomentarius]|nr:hypothetical protein C8Q74DRAFT_1435057 [Fomes fomentarius]
MSTFDRLHQMQRIMLPADNMVSSSIAVGDPDPDITLPDAEESQLTFSTEFVDLPNGPLQDAAARLAKWGGRFMRTHQSGDPSWLAIFGSRKDITGFDWSAFKWALDNHPGHDILPYPFIAAASGMSKAIFDVLFDASEGIAGMELWRSHLEKNIATTFNNPAKSIMKGFFTQARREKNESYEYRLLFALPTTNARWVKVMVLTIKLVVDVASISRLFYFNSYQNNFSATVDRMVLIVRDDFDPSLAAAPKVQPSTLNVATY